MSEPFSRVLTDAGLFFVVARANFRPPKTSSLNRSGEVLDPELICFLRPASLLCVKTLAFPNKAHIDDVLRPASAAT
jgi:hypothetical protein